MRNKRRKKKETNRHVKKYNRVRIFGNIIYWACMIITCTYWIYIFLLSLLYEDEQVAQFPLTNTWIMVVTGCFPLVSAAEYYYEKLLKRRAENVLMNREERKDFYRLHR